jgi:2'-5' RNA ligase
MAMRVPLFHRYFLGIRPDPRLYPALQAFGRAAGQSIHLTHLHLTFCVIEESAGRDRFVAERVRKALDGQRLHSFPVNLSRIMAGPHGAMARTAGRQDDIQDFYRQLVRLLRPCGIEPMYRKSGLHPHMTLGHDPCEAAVLPIALEWYPGELLLIESEYGLTRHNVLGRWALLPPRQPFLPFRDAIAAAGPARRSAA